MTSKAAFVVVFTGCVVAACGGGGGGSTSSQGPEPTSESNPTTPAGGSAPAAEEEKKDEQQPGGPASALTMNPSCAPQGYRVVLKLGLTRDQHVPNCYKVDEARVTFAPDKRAKVTLMGPASDGFCALDVEVPEGAESGKVRVEIGNDAFESDAVFAVPCP